VREANKPICTVCLSSGVGRASSTMPGTGRLPIRVAVHPWSFANSGSRCERYRGSKETRTRSAGADHSSGIRANRRQVK